MKTSIFQRTRGPQPTARFYTGSRRLGALAAFIIMLAATLYSASSASVSSRLSRQLTNKAASAAARVSEAGRDSNLVGANTKGAMAESRRDSTSTAAAPAWLSPALQAQLSGESIQTYAPDCTTPRTSFVLGETVCVKVTGAPLGTDVQRRISWVNPDGVIVRLSDITSDPQSDSAALPNSSTIVLGASTLNVRGTWRLNTIATYDASLRSEAFFTVRDPANAATDVSVAVNKFGIGSVPADQNVAFTLDVTNNGPDNAASVELTNPTPAGTTFVSITQTSGPTFTCSNPLAGNTGTIVCTIPSMAKDDTARFTAIYKVDAGTPTGTTLINSASVANTVADLRPSNNVAADAAKVGPATCTVACPSDIVVENANNAAGATVDFTIPTNNCSSVTAEPASGSFFPVGTTLVTVSSSTGSICTFKVTVNDTQVPVISCPSDVTADENPQTPGQAVVEYAPPTVTDNEEGLRATCDHPSGSSFPVGDTLVTCTATDSSGNTSQPCTFTVHVNGDNCSLTCPEDIIVDADTGACKKVVTYAAQATECGTVTYSHPSGSEFPVGTTTVTVTAPNRSCSFNVTVRDTTPPELSVSAPPEVLTAPVTNTADDTCVATIPDLRPYITTSDNCASNVRIIQEPEAGSLVHAGPHTITISALDGDPLALHNTSTAEVTFTARDETPPTIALDGAPSITIECHTTFNDPGATATDVCAGSFPATPSDTLDVNTPGTYTITYTASDPAGNAYAGPPVTRTVIVEDTQKPTIALNGANPMTVECHTTFNDPGATATDGCAGSFAATPSGSVDVNTVGSYTITYSASDPSGNAATPVTRTVNVVDTTPPTIVVNGANPMTVECHTSFTDPGATAVDGCSGNSPASASGTVNVNTPGTYTITYNATDSAGNAATPVTRTVNVVDTTPPTINCPANIVVSLPPNSTAVSMPVSYPAVTASDSCSSSVNVTSSPASGSVFPVGTTVVNATATDAAGNTSSCSFTVTVLYSFTGFFSPVDNLPVLNMVNAGRAIPVKFSLSGNKGLGIFAPNHPASVEIACSSSAPVNEVEETITAGSSSLSYDASSDQYIYVWKTNSAWAGTCRQLVVKLNDGTYHRANFKFR
jgi:uncharacterized repeat protein (TIGR01451 family)